jgi:glycosyltransferase involved in cell wall biosynthesis
MKILWVKNDFLHPTTRGGQIRTLEMLRRLHARHEIHYVAFEDAEYPQAVTLSSEYCSHAYPVPKRIAPKRSVAFAGQLVGGFFSSLPVAISRYRSAEMMRTIDMLRERERFDTIVCDFLTCAPNIRRLEDCVLFQHNVETVIWERHARNAPDPLRKFYFGLQARRMLAYECHVCRSVARVVAVSDADAEWMRSRFEAPHTTAIPTGVNLEYFSPPVSSPPAADLIFVGSMDWLANIDGVRYLVKEILPLIRRRRPDCSLAIVGRNPTPEIQAMARQDPGIQVTGTVADIRPYLWGSLISIVPLRIGGGTRLKIYESMAAKVPVVSTSVGAEGLECRPGLEIRIADTAEAFAEACLGLLENAPARAQMAEAAWQLVSSRFSWEQVARCFEGALELAPR